MTTSELLALLIAAALIGSLMAVIYFVKRKQKSKTVKLENLEIIKS